MRNNKRFQSGTKKKQMRSLEKELGGIRVNRRGALIY
jgi:hypothetical protein